MFLLLLIAPKQKNFCVTKDRVPLRGLAKAGPRIVFVPADGPRGGEMTKRAAGRTGGFVGIDTLQCYHGKV